MAIVKQYHKDSGITYVFESESYWDSEKKQARSRRRCIGKLDPVTGEIVPNGRKGRPGKDAAEGTNPKASASTSGEAEAVRRENGLLREELTRLKKELEYERDRRGRLEEALAGIRDVIARNLEE